MADLRYRVEWYGGCWQVCRGEGIDRAVLMESIDRDTMLAAVAILNTGTALPAMEIAWLVGGQPVEGRR